MKHHLPQVIGLILVYAGGCLYLAWWLWQYMRDWDEKDWKGR